MRALVINTSRMGDLIQCTPLFQGLQKQGFEVTLLYSGGFRDIAQLLGGVDRLIHFPISGVVTPLIVPQGEFADSFRLLDRLILRLRRLEFDLVINATHSRYSGFLTVLAGGKETVGLSADGRDKRQVTGSWAQYYFHSQVARGLNRFNMVDIHRKLGGVATNHPVKLNVPEAARRRAIEMLGHNAAGDGLLVGVVPGASTPEKTLPVETFALGLKMLQQELPVLPVILGAATDVGVADRLAKLLPEALNLCGKTDIATLAGVISRCRLLLTNDTGPMHIAAAVGTPVVDVSLGSALAYETAPYGEGHYVIEARIGCHPCLPKMRCSHLSCRLLTPPNVIAAVARAALTKTRPELGTGAADLPVNVFCTTFDRDGYQGLRPLIRRPLTAADIFQTALRELWKRALDGKPIPMDQFDDSTAAGLSSLYGQPATSLNLEGALEGVEKLGEIARIGAGTADELAKVGGDPSHIATLKEFAAALEEIDRGVAQIAYARPETMPLTAQFINSKENLVSDDLVSLAKETAHLFGQLAEWCDALARSVRALTRPFIRADGAAVEAA